ncbi:MAG: hypothetical protein WAK16_13055 [Candidatus Cybelea sp.]|jgi:hypothetical protein
MRSLSLSRYAVSSCATAALLAGCGGSQPPINAPGAMPHSRAISSHADRGASCQYYAECITLAYGSPFEQEWCAPRGVRLGFGSTCTRPNYGTWQWYRKVFNLARHHSRKWIEVSAYPNPGNPVDMTISESQRIKPSHGEIVYMVSLEACSPFSGGIECLKGKVGISTK